MNRRAVLGLLVALIVAGSPGASPAESAAGQRARPRAPERSAPAIEGQTDWIAAAADNVCGLRDPRMLSSPAKLDFEAVLAATAEMEKLRRDSIDPASPEGVRLRQAAADRVFRASDAVRVADGHCSVWKAIRHRDGRQVPDVTEAVKVKLREVSL